MDIDPSVFHSQRIIIHGTLPCAFNVSLSWYLFQVKENQGPKQVMKSLLKCPRPKGGKNGQWCQGELSCKDSYHVQIDHVRGDKEVRVSAVL